MAILSVDRWEDWDFNKIYTSQFDEDISDFNWHTSQVKTGL